MRIADSAGRRLAGFGTTVFTELTGGRYVTLQPSDLSRLLFERVKGRIESIFGDEIVALHGEPDCVRVDLKHVGERRFDLMIGADGLHSTVRKLVFGSQSQFQRHLGYIVAAFEVRGYRPRDEDVCLIYGQPGRMVGRFRLCGDRTLILLVFAAGDAALPVTLEAQTPMLRDAYGRDVWECPRILAEPDRTDELYLDRISRSECQTGSGGASHLLAMPVSACRSWPDRARRW
jgi:2-polyprenyl-6-methoxyphenol hydroxylase-like FAD-dependent oxidoreductase